MKKVNSDRYSAARFFYYIGLLTIGLNSLRPVFEITVSDWFFIISLSLTIIESLYKRNICFKLPRYMPLGILFFAIGGIISSGFSKMPIESFIALFKYLYLIIWIWLGNFLLLNNKQIKTSIVLWISSSAISSFGALIQLILSIINHGTIFAWGRMNGLTEHVNNLGGLTAVAMIPAIMILRFFSKNIFNLIFNIACCFFIAGGLLLSVSMSGIVAMIVSLLIWIAISRSYLKNTLSVFMIALLLFGAIYIQCNYQNINVISRLYDINEQGFYLYTIESRLETYSAAWNVIKAKPLIGVGLGPDVGLTKTGYMVHNIFLLNWYESGLLGLIGMIIFITSIILLSFKGIKNPKNKEEETIGAALFSSFIGFMIIGLAQPIYYERYGWISAALLISLYSNYKRNYCKNIMKEKYQYVDISSKLYFMK